MFRRALLLCCITILMFAVLSACGSKTAETPTTPQNESKVEQGKEQADQADTGAEAVKKYTDIKGEKEIPTHPQRVVTDQYLMQMLSLGSVPIGAVTYQLEDKISMETGLIGNVQDIGSPVNLEAVVALNPDLIITANEDLYEQYSKIATTVLLPWTAFNAFEQVEQVGILLGKEKEAEEWLEKFRAKEAEYKQAAAALMSPDETVSIFAIMGKNDLRVYGQRNIGYVFYRSLGIKAPAEVQKLYEGKEDEFVYADASQEMLPEFAGDNILLMVRNGDEDSQTLYKDLLESGLWKNIPVVKNKKVYMLDEDYWFIYNSLALNYQLEKSVDIVKELKK
ncbi:ABC transporter substrate-binding protein [Cohnella abietis]|uniref:ABC transporter substrate-binding protein n=1 Tax=Cohnella abietis TaxID=2507935 RepID=A0A3T1DB18_9BACL|nr:ABC transporter substrate-binding protein [Cohnella abietis]BBI35234.1 ABC transporter substrate-binding protein [Cohnella abietis]